jgi:Icc-related predicted phosphoesterase
MIVSALSDTHGYHTDVKLPGGDLLLYAGDCGSHGSYKKARGFLNWYSKQNYKHKVFVAGNHDLCFDDAAYVTLLKDHCEKQGIIYLENAGTVIDGVNIWGSPITPKFGWWAFMYNRGCEIKRYWDMIPNETNILITHGPPKDILDLTLDNGTQGCEELRKRVDILPALKYHIFGHIHEDYGVMEVEGTKYMNVSYCNIPLTRDYVMQPITFEYESGELKGDS